MLGGVGGIGWDRGVGWGRGCSDWVLVGVGGVRVGYWL